MSFHIGGSLRESLIDIGEGGFQFVAIDLFARMLFPCGLLCGDGSYAQQQLSHELEESSADSQHEEACFAPVPVVVGARFEFMSRA